MKEGDYLIEVAGIPAQEGQDFLSGLDGRVDQRRIGRDTAWGGYPGGLAVTKGEPLFPRKRP